MARIRSIKPGFFTNDALAEIDPLGRLLFAGLWCHADRAGRLEDRPRKLKAEVLPYDTCDVDALLNDLQRHGFIQRYEANGTRFIQVITFSKHQTPNIKEVESIIPAPGESAPAPPQDMPAQYQHSANTVPALHLTVLEQEQEQEQEQVPSLVQEGVQGGVGGGATAPRNEPVRLSPRRPVPKPKDEPAPKNPWWDALVAGIGVTPSTDQERQLYGKTVRELRAIDASPEEILRRCANYRVRFPNAELTCTALTKHWSRVEHLPVAGPSARSPDGAALSNEQAKQQRTKAALLGLGGNHAAVNVPDEPVEARFSVLRRDNAR